MIKRLLSGLLIGVLIAGATIPASAQGSLSQQVLRLLTRDNFWSGTNTYAHDKGVILEVGTAPTTTTNTLYNVGGNLFWNGSLVTTASGVGTVTSVALTVPAIFSVTGSPITSSGTLAVSLATQSANVVFAGPTSGGAATPAFRAIVDNDVPNTITIDGTGNVTWASVSKSGSSLADLATRSASDLSSGTLPNGRFPATLPAASGVNLTALNASNLSSGTVPAAQMPALTGDITTTVGTVATTLAASGVTAGSYTLASITVDAKGRITTAANGTFSAASISGTVPVANGGTNISSYAVGDILYASASGVLSKLNDVATGNALISGGVTTAPSWGKIGLTTHVSGTLPFANGGTGLTVAADDTVMVSNGTAWQAKAMVSGVNSYDTTTNTFSAPTTYIFGTGAPTPSANNVLLRSTFNGIGELTLGNQSAYAGFFAGDISVGNAVTQDYFGGASQNAFDDSITPSADTLDHKGVTVFLLNTPSVDQSHVSGGLMAFTTFAGTKNSSKDSEGIFGLYGGSYFESSGNVAAQNGVVGDAEFGGAGTATWVRSFYNFTGSYGSGTITNEAIYYGSTPFNVGGGTVTNHYGIYLEDQTLAGTTIDDAIRYAAPSSKTFILTAAGLMGVYGGTPTANSPLRVGGTISAILTNNGNSGTTKTIDLSAGNTQRVTLTGNVTFTLSNPTDGARYDLIIYSGAGGFTAAWPGTVKWAAGTAPTITATAARADVIHLIYDSTAGDYFGWYDQNMTP